MFKFKNYFHVAENYFDKEFCQKVIESAKTGEYGIHDRNVEGIRKSEVVFFPHPEYDEDTKWLYDPVFDLLEETKKKNWRTFKLDRLQDLQYTMYYADGGYYNWHTDTAGHNDPGDAGTASNQRMASRTLSISIHLNDPDEYTGGELEIVKSVSDNIWKVMWGQEPDRDLVETIRLGQGSALIFPSVIQHRVLPVHGGQRQSLVGWCTGRMV